MAFKKFLVASDVHGGEQDPAANKVLFEFQKVWKPEIKVCAGDLWDFAALRKKASEEERRTSMRDDYYAGLDWFLRFQPTHFLRGNHDERLWDLREDNRGPLSDYAAECIKGFETELKKAKCWMLPYERRLGMLEIGKLRILHGFYAGVNAARRSAQTWGSCLVGHAHSVQMASIEGPENRVGRVIGCLCNLDMKFQRANPSSLLHRHGFAYGVIDDRKGTYQVHQAEKVGDKWILPSGFKEY